MCPGWRPGPYDGPRPGKPAPSAEPDAGTIVGTGWVSRDGANAYGYKTRYREVDVELDSDGDLLVDIEERWGVTGDKCCCTIKASILRALLSRAGLSIVPAGDVPTPEERKVLEAMAAIEPWVFDWIRHDNIALVPKVLHAPLQAELARRAATKTDPAERSRRETGDW